MCFVWISEQTAIISLYWFYDMIYLLTAIVLTPVAAVQYTFTHKQYVEQHN
jgi:hypothetical protein